MDITQILAYAFVVYLAYTQISKEGLKFSLKNFKREKKEKTDHKDTTKPDLLFNALEVDKNTSQGRLIKGVSPDQDGYVMNPEFPAIEITTDIPAGTQIRVFQKGLSREVSGHWYIDYKLNPSAPEMVRALKSGTLKRVIEIAMEIKEEKNYPYYLAGLGIIAFYLLYQEIQGIKDVIIGLHS